MKNSNININLNSGKAREILTKYNIELPNDFGFSKINILIGSNGSGKTRFLKAVREIYNIDGENKVMYGYFPGLSSCKTAVVVNNELPLCTLYESLQESEIEFDDFLQEIELHNEEYIPQLLDYHSRLQQVRGEKALKTLQETFYTISGKQILFEGKVCIKDKNNRVQSLEKALLEFSPGELMIFYMSVFLSLQKNSNQKRVIILDEPECHLHPKALLKFIQILKHSDYFTAVWIATHSLFLIPQFDFREIIYIENSKIYRRTSAIYKEIISDLIGEESTGTTQFIASLSQWEYAEYIAECFTDPEVIGSVNPEDEQVKLFIDFIEKKKTIKVLDFGGGSARLGLSLKLSNNEKAREIIYEICDKEPRYIGDEFRVYRSLNEIEDKYDCVVMMNVLHEIDPNDWMTLFKNMAKVLKKNAYLLFVETAVLSKGEMPNETGFLVLDSQELSVLFSSPTPLEKVVIKDKQKSICIPIPQSLIENITTNSIHKAISSLEERVLATIKSERGKKNFQTSRYYAFLTQQYINAKIFNDAAKTIPFKKISTEPKKKESGGIDESILSRYKSTSSSKLLKRLIGRLKEYSTTQKEEKIRNTISMLIISLEGMMMRQKRPAELVINVLWRDITLLEKIGNDKIMISVFLLAFHILGDERAKKIINNNEYLKHITCILDRFLELDAEDGKKIP